MTVIGMIVWPVILVQESIIQSVANVISDETQAIF